MADATDFTCWVPISRVKIGGIISGSNLWLRTGYMSLHSTDIHTTQRRVTFSAGPLASKIRSRMRSVWWVQILQINGNTRQLRGFIVVYFCRWLWWAKVELDRLIQ